MPRPVIRPRILTREEAAIYAGFKGAAGAFPKWLQQWGVRPLPRHHGAFDVRDLDAAVEREKGGAANDAPAPQPDQIDW